MAIIITVDNIRIDFWTVDVEERMVEVHFWAIDANNETVGDKQVAFFWETIPQDLDAEGNPIPPPDTYYQLPSGYITTLINLTQDCKAALMHLINE